jgi:hypothetical protein
MTPQRDIEKFPTEKPPNSDSENLGTAGTATGVEVHSLPNRTTESYCKRNENIQPAAAVRPARSNVSERPNAHGRRRYNAQPALVRTLIAAGSSAGRGAAS